MRQVMVPGSTVTDQSSVASWSLSWKPMLVTVSKTGFVTVTMNIKILVGTVKRLNFVIVPV